MSTHYDVRRYVKGDFFGHLAKVIAVNLNLDIAAHIKNHMNARRLRVGESDCVYGIIQVCMRSERRGLVF